MNKIELMYQEFGEHPEPLTCKTCPHLTRHQWDETYTKCSVYGVSRSEATDWRQKWHACNAYDLPEKEVSKYEIKRLAKGGRKVDDEPIPGQMTLAEGVRILGDIICEEIDRQYGGEVIG